ncbi:MAG TPA: thiamine-phosphate kinase [Candidatus Xenobia bacterium]|nr:thiamine-phosphate kinase [Candidatus Xenobia bacterium]
MRGEAEIVRFLAERFRAGGAVRVGIGDDAAVLAGEARRDWVLTTDLLVENVHFVRAWQPARAVGWKALARSLSDVAAMGARPVAALVALALPADTPTAWVKEFFRGVDVLARRFDVRVIGGDLSSASQIVADVQALGEVKKGRALLRRGARPGDILFVSGSLGLSQLGLLHLRSGGKSTQPLLKRALRAHLYPWPRITLARALQRYRPTAMIDLSDGLSTDLHHLCEASRVGACVFAPRLPAVDLSAPLARRLHTTAMELALNGGEDYQLLFTLPPSRQHLPEELEGVRLTAIGEITPDPRVVLVDSAGRAERLPSRGWDHFRRAR